MRDEFVIIKASESTMWTLIICLDRWCFFFSLTPFINASTGLFLLTELPLHFLRPDLTDDSFEVVELLSSLLVCTSHLDGCIGFFFVGCPFTVSSKFRLYDKKAEKYN